MTPDKLTVRCMAWQESGLWVASCIDLTLAAQGNTLDDARATLRGQIIRHINEAVTVDAAHSEELLSRRAPLRDQIRFVFWRALSRRPRVRRMIGAAARRVLPALSLRLSYVEPLQILVA